MRFLIPTALTLVCAFPAMAQQVQFSNVVKASLVFRDDFEAARHYPHIIKVFLRLDNAHDSDVCWVANAKTGIDAELLDAAGNPVAQEAQATSIQSNPSAYMLPYGSRLDWLISHGGIALAADTKNKYALIVGSRGWLIPIPTAATYSLRIRLRGLPWTRSSDSAELREPQLLLDLPAAKIEITK
jgi:hypothetical protein